MLLLGIDTSGKTASAALFDSDTETFLAQSALYTQKTHSQVIMPMVRDILAQAGKKRAESMFTIPKMIEECEISYNKIINNI